MRHIRRALPITAALWIGLSGIFFTWMPATAASNPATAPTNKAANAATPKLSMAAAEKSAMSLFAIPASAALTMQTYNASSQQTPASYSFTFQDSANQNNQTTVTMDANTGTVLSYYRTPLQNRFVFPLPITSAQAQQAAIAWAKKLYPSQYSQVRIQPLTATAGPLTTAFSFQYNFERIVNGIPAPFDGFTVTIDQNGKLTGASENWSSATFPTVALALTLQKANLVYQQSLHFYLAYAASGQGNAASSTQLTYQLPQGFYPNNWNAPYGSQLGISTPVINAQSGTVINSNGVTEALPVHQTAVVLVPGGPTNSPGVTKVNWTEAQALAYAKAAAQIPATATLTASTQSSGQAYPTNNDVVWDFTWQTAQNAQQSATVDATYGVMTQYSDWSNTTKPLYAQQAQKPAISQVQADQSADVFVKRLFPTDTGGIAVVPNAYSKFGGTLQTTYSVYFMQNGIANVSSTGNIGVDPTTGAVTSFWFAPSFPTATLPLPRSALPILKIDQNWIKANPLQLQYLMTQPQSAAIYGKGLPATSTQNLPPTHIVLAYAPSGSFGYGTAVDALTGAILNTGGTTPVPYTGTVKDLAGVAAAPEIALLVNHGLLAVDASGDVHPYQFMTRASFIKLVVDTLGYNGNPAPQQGMAALLGNMPTTDPAYNEIVSAYERGWLPQGVPINPTALITRADAAHILVEALGFGVLLSHASAFSLPATDASMIPSDQFSAAAIAYTLGMMQLVGGQFDPSGNVDVAQGAVAAVQLANNYAQGPQLMFQGMGAMG